MLRRSLLLPALIAVIAACSSSGKTERVRTVSCESRDSSFAECERVGSSMVAVSRQISDTPCVQGVSWGVRDGMLWVDRGCRAEFRVGGPAIVGSSAGESSLVCESQDGRLTRCRANTFGGVRLARQISDSECVFDRTWGWDAQGVWVNEGCRGEFVIGGASTGTRSSIVCESQSGRRSHCPVDTRFGVELIRQLSDSPCVRNRTWGEDSEGIWVDDGCRGEFVARSQ